MFLAIIHTIFLKMFSYYSYSRALFCYEELVLLYPKKYMYMMRIAEVNSNQHRNILFALKIHLSNNLLIEISRSTIPSALSKIYWVLVVTTPSYWLACPITIAVFGDWFKLPRNWKYSDLMMLKMKISSK